ncbi:MAG: PorV/PorQ family protein, partial [Elusimicrobia bacterium]|nr:PorV/PorQ family protein [Elusimicrobiota bacterium]
EMKRRIAQSLIALLSLFAFSQAHARGAGTSGGLTLLEAPGARASSLGEAFSAMSDDVSAFAYNPSTLRSLQTGQASFLYQKGLMDDAYSQLMLGSPWHRMGLGMSVGYYNGGNFKMSDGVTEHDVNAEKDLMIALGGAKTFGRFSLGMTGKYLSSELVQTVKASAYAVDFGFNFGVNSRLNVGGALQNLGTQLKFVNEGDNLPRIARMGASYALSPKHGTLLLVDVEHLMNEGETRPAIGIETRVGPLALRAGYRISSTQNEFSMGTGFAFGRSSLDYAFGMSAQDLKSSQRVSYSFRFGGPGGGNSLFVKPASQAANELVSMPAAPAPVAKTGSAGKLSSEKGADKGLSSSKGASASANASPKRRIYVIKDGDTLAKIAKNVYGDAKMWRTIYLANRHLISSPTDVEPGMKITLP